MNRSAAYAIGPVILVVLVLIGALGLCFLQPERDKDVSRGFKELEETLDMYGVLPHDFARNNEQARVLVLVGRACVVVTGRFADRVTADKAKYAAIRFLDGNGFDGVKARLIVSKRSTIMHMRWTAGSFKSSGSVTFPVGAFYQAMRPICETQKMVVLVEKRTEYKSPVSTIMDADSKVVYDASRFGVGQSIKVSGKTDKRTILVYLVVVLIVLGFCTFQAYLISNQKLSAVECLVLMRKRYLPISAGLALVCLPIGFILIGSNLDLRIPTHWYLDDINGVVLFLIKLYPAFILSLTAICTSFLIAALTKTEVELELLPHTEVSARLKRSREIMYSMIPWVTAAVFLVVLLAVFEENYSRYSTIFLFVSVALFLTIPKLFSLFNLSYRTHTASLNETWIQLTKGFLNGLNVKLAKYPNTRPCKMVLDDSDNGVLMPYIKRGLFGRLLVSVKVAQMMDCDELELLVTTEACTKRSKAFWYLLGCIPAVYWILFAMQCVKAYPDTPHRFLFAVGCIMLSFVINEIFKAIYTSHIKTGIRFALYYTHDKDAAVSAFDKIIDWKFKTPLDYPEKEMEINESVLLESVIESKKKVRKSVSLD